MGAIADIVLFDKWHEELPPFLQAQCLVGLHDGFFRVCYGAHHCADAVDVFRDYV